MRGAREGVVVPPRQLALQVELDAERVGDLAGGGLDVEGLVARALAGAAERDLRGLHLESHGGDAAHVVDDLVAVLDRAVGGHGDRGRTDVLDVDGDLPGRHGAEPFISPPWITAERRRAFCLNAAR